MSKLLSPLLITGLILTLACIATAANPPGDSTDDWPSYGHDPGGMRYSPLTQINRENVAKLKIAWIFHTGDISEGKGQRKRSGFETTPLVVDRTLYLTTPFNRVIALDPEIGQATLGLRPENRSQRRLRRRAYQPRRRHMARSRKASYPALPSPIV